MPLTDHQKLHLNRVLIDAEDLNLAERNRVKREAQNFLDERTVWPEIRKEGDIHEWIERVDRRDELLAEKIAEGVDRG